MPQSSTENEARGVARPREPWGLTQPHKRGEGSGTREVELAPLAGRFFPWPSAWGFPETGGLCMATRNVEAEAPMIEMATPGESNPWRARYLAHLQRRYGAGLDRYRHDTFAAALQATRPLVIAEALIVVLIGFSIDDLAVLRLPGFLVGLAAAILVFVFAGLLHGVRWSEVIRGKSVEGRAAWLRRRQSAGRASLLLVSLLFAAWLVVFSSGVPPWTA